MLSISTMLFVLSFFRSHFLLVGAIIWSKTYVTHWNNRTINLLTRCPWPLDAVIKDNLFCLWINIWRSCNLQWKKIGTNILESHNMLGYSVLCWKDQKLLLTEDFYLLFTSTRENREKILKNRISAREKLVLYFVSKSFVQQKSQLKNVDSRTQFIGNKGKLWR